MAEQTPRSIRNVVLVGHHGAGKTTLAEALLAVTGAISRQGSVEKGTTVCDFEPEEVSRQLSVSLAIAPFTRRRASRSTCSTPRATPTSTPTCTPPWPSADLAVVVVSATDGVQAQTEDAWRAAAALGLPRVIVVNKLDRERASFDRTLAEIRAAFGAGVAPVELPIGAEAAFRGVIDLLDDRATLYDPAGGPPITGIEGPIPDDLAITEHEVHEQLVEGIVVGDDDLMARYLDGETISRDELEGTLAGGVAAGAVFPVLCCSGATGVGRRPPGPAAGRAVPRPRGPPAGDRPGRRHPLGGRRATRPARPLLVVCKTTADQHAGRITLAKVVSGTLRPDTVLTNPRTRTDERLHVLQPLRGTRGGPGRRGGGRRLRGRPPAQRRRHRRHPGPQGHAGDGALPRRPPSRPSRWRSIRRRGPTTTSSCRRCSGCARRIPALRVTRVDETHQTVLGLSGEVHLAVTLERLARRFGVHVEREDVTVPYRETITRPADAEGKHKKQSGGHGQFGVCHLVIEPLPRGEGFVFIDKVVGGAIPRQYIPAVEKGVVEAMAAGGVFGYPVVDVAVTVDDGKFHPVDSSELSFKTGGHAGLPPGHGRCRAGCLSSPSPGSRSPCRPSSRVTCWATCTHGGPASREPTTPAAASRPWWPWCPSQSWPATRSTCGPSPAGADASPPPTTTTTPCPSSWCPTRADRWPAASDVPTPDVIAGWWRLGVGRPGGGEPFPGRVQGLGHDPHPGHRGHEVGVAGPAGQHVEVEVRRDPGPGGPAQVGPQVDPVGLVGRGQGAPRPRRWPPTARPTRPP